MKKIVQKRRTRESLFRYLWLLPLMMMSALQSNAQTTTIVGPGADAGSQYIPMYTFYGYSYTQQIFLDTDMSAAGITAGSTITKLYYKFTNAPTNFSTMGNWGVYLGNSTKTSFSSGTDWVAVSSMTEVYNGTVPSFTGTPNTTTWYEIVLTTPFVYTGGSLIVAIDENTPGYSGGSSSNRWLGMAATNRGLRFYSDYTNPNPASPPSGVLYSYIAKVQMEYTPGTPCVGMPTGGTASASPSSGGTSSTFTLSASGVTSGTGISYQWQKSADGLTGWTDIAGATTVSYLATAVSTITTTYYRLRVICTTTSDTTYSSNTTYETVPILCTSHTANNGAGMVTFHVENTNSYPININGIKAYMGTSSPSTAGTFNFKLYYKPTAVLSSGSSWTDGNIGDGVNGWTTAATQTVTLASDVAPQTVISGMTLEIPAGSTYTLCLTVQTGTLGYMTLTSGAGVNTFSGGGVNIKTGDNISWGGSSKYTTPGNPTNYPRGFVGCVMYNIPCLPITAVTASNDGPKCAGQDVQLTGTMDGTMASFSWSGPGGYASTDTNPVLTGTTTAMSGDYILTVTSTGGCTSSDTTTVTINPTPASITLTPSDITICPGTSTMLTATGGSGGTFVWSPIGGTGSGTLNENYTVTPTAALTNYTASVTNAFGCTTVSDTAKVRLNPMPLGISQVSPTTCGGTNGYITISGLDAGETYTMSYTLDGTTYTSGSITASAFGTVTLTGLGAGAYTDIDVTKTSTGCESNKNYTATLNNPTPPTPVIDSVTHPAMCGSASGTIHFSGLANSTAYTISYEKDGTPTGPVSFTTSATGTYDLGTLAAGAYTNIIITRTSSGCSSAPLSTTLNSPVAPTIAFVSVTHPTTCSGNDGEMVLSGLIPGEAYGLDYTLDGTPGSTTGTADGSGNVTFSGLSAGAYTYITVTNSMSCASNSLDSTLNDPAQDPLSVTPTTSTNCGGTITTITVSGGDLGGTAPVYSWSPMTGLYLDAGATTPYAGEDVAIVYANPTATTTYTVTATVGACNINTTADVEVLAASENAALTTALQNGVNLSEICTDGGWTYYTDLTDPTMPYFIGINWGSTNAAAQAAAIITIQYDATDYAAVDSGAQMGTFTSKRYWNVDLGTESLVDPVSVRVFYDPAELAALNALASDFATATGGAVETPTWFKTVGTAFAPGASTVTPDKVENAIALVDVAPMGATLNGIHYAQFDGITSFSGGTYAAGVGAGTPLNISLGNFSAQHEGKSNKVSWNTLSEEAGVVFHLEKSTDGRSFAEIAKVPGKGVPSNYTHYDNNPVKGYNYYRLNMVGVNGNKAQSGIVYVWIDESMNNTMTVFPNPTDKDITIQIEGVVGKQAKIQITDLSGRVIEEITNLQSNEIKVNLGAYAQGVYMIKYTDGKFTHTVKVTKQ